MSKASVVVIVSPSECWVMEIGSRHMKKKLKNGRLIYRPEHCSALQKQLQDIVAAGDN